jgi:hypothetical protein
LNGVGLQDSKEFVQRAGGMANGVDGCQELFHRGGTETRRMPGSH